MKISLLYKNVPAASFLGKNLVATCAANPVAVGACNVKVQ
jgi:hypothetical protein